MVLFEELSKIVERAKNNEKCLKAIADIKEKTIFIEATDTGEKCYFQVKEGSIIGPFKGDFESPDVKLIAPEDVFLRIWKGEMDPDAGYLLGRVKIKGSFFDAVKVKNVFEIVKG